MGYVLNWVILSTVVCIFSLPLVLGVCCLIKGWWSRRCRVRDDTTVWRERQQVVHIPYTNADGETLH